MPHDTFEYDARRGTISSQTTRYKIGFIQETETGAWKELKIARRLGRSRSLSTADVREVALQTLQLAKRLSNRIQVMWFCNIPSELGIGRNLPWFSMKAPDVDTKGRNTVGPSRSRVPIRNTRDLRSAKALPVGRYVLTAHPNVDLIRSDDRFLKDLADVALSIDAPVELHGSILGHAYYMLHRAGVTVIAAGEPSYTRVRGRQVFAKLVRDYVPDRIREHGETTILAHIAKEEARAALIVKLFEEAHELLRAESPDDVQAELADVLEVVRSLATATGISWEDVEKTADAKRANRGGFEKGTLLMETSWPKAGIVAASEQRTLPLKALATKKESSVGAELNYAALIAGGADRTIKSRDGTIYQITLTAFGIKLAMVEPSKEPEEQLSLPVFD